MLKIFTNFISLDDFLTGMNDTPGSTDFYRNGNDDLKYKSISLFNDHPANEHQLSLNDVNILMIMEPNQSYNLHNYAIQNYNQYSAILTWGQEILDNCPNAVFHPMGDNLMGRTRDMLVQLCEINNLPDDQFASQEGEDKWIIKNLKLPENGTFLDIGACYPIIISNTYHFETFKGWNGLAIEPDPTYYKLFSEGRKCIVENVAIHPTETEMWYKPLNNLVESKDDDSIRVECARLDNLLEKHNITKVDLISIDVEGYEEQVWSSFDYKKYSPEVMIVEHTEMGQYNDGFAKKLLADPDYELVHATPLNFIIAKKGLKK